MRIKSLRVKSHFSNWEFDNIEFTTNLTLLVGASGVGKTQILRSIDDLKDISLGRPINGFEWSIRFITNSQTDFIWEGKYSVIEKPNLNSNYTFPDTDNEKPTPIIERESLTEVKTNKIIIKRDKKSIYFNDKETPKLSSSKSAINILSEEPIISEVLNAFKKITLKDNTQRDFGISFFHKPITHIYEKLDTYEKIKNSNENIRVKLYLMKKRDLPEFQNIKSRFIDIFPQVEDIKIEQIENQDIPFRTEQTVPVISIKETGINQWIKEENMSSGMLRTLIHVSEILVSNDGSVNLIDEFENSLGVNCIDVLTDDIIHEKHSIQFIATSHHPYIINNIPYEYWKIVSRKGGKISVKDAAEFKIGKSKQDAFIQLTKIIHNS